VTEALGSSILRHPNRNWKGRWPGRRGRPACKERGGGEAGCTRRPEPYSPGAAVLHFLMMLRCICGQVWCLLFVLIRQFLIVGGFYSEVVLQKREAEGTVRTKHQLNLDPHPEGTQKNLDDRRYCGREEQRIPHVRGGAGAAQGVTGYLRALGDRTGSTVTNYGASVPEVLTPAMVRSVCWCLLFVLIRHGLRGGSGPQRLITALGAEAGNPIIYFVSMIGISTLCLTIIANYGYHSP